MLTALQFQTFNGEFVRRLIDGDADAGAHFASYFGTLLHCKLRTRLRAGHIIEDVSQATLLRALQILHRGDGLRRPECLGAFVNSVCENVLREHYRAELRYEPWDPATDPADASINMDAELTNEDMKSVILEVMRELPEMDRRILNDLFLNELDREVICRKYDITADYLRVLKHRAMKHFREICAARGLRR